MTPTPDLPSSSRGHVVATDSPNGETIPIPVTTTRLIAAQSVVQTESLGQCRALSQIAPERDLAVSNALALRRRAAAPLLLHVLDELDRVGDRHDLLRRLVRNLDPELFLERHDQLDRVEAVRAQIVDELGAVGHLGFLDAQVLDDDLFDAL